MKVFNFGNDYAHADRMRKGLGQKIEAVTRLEAIEAVKEAVAQEDAGDQMGLEGAEGDLEPEAEEGEEGIRLPEEPEEAHEEERKNWKKNRRKGKR